MHVLQTAAALRAGSPVKAFTTATPCGQKGFFESADVLLLVLSLLCIPFSHNLLAMTYLRLGNTVQ